MVEIKPATQTDKPKWDAYVLNHPEASPYHLFAWKNAVEKAYRHKAYYFMAERDDQILGIMPTFHFSLYHMINELVALPFCDVGNCICDNPKIQAKLLSELLSLGNRLKVKHINLRGELSASRSIPDDFSQSTNNKVRMLLALPESSESLLKSFKSKLRSQIRKAEKNGVRFRWADSDGVDAFYSVFCRNMKDLGSPVHSKKWFASIMESYGNNAKIGLAEYDGQCIGAGLILFTGKQTCIPWASTLSRFNRLAPNMLLYWNFLKFAADNGMHCFDFGRSTENEGTYKFKKQWGAAPKPLSWYDYPRKPGNHKPAQPTVNKREIAAKIWQQLPLQAANLIGPLCRKYINL